MRKQLILLFLIAFWGLRLSATEPPAIPFAYVTYNDGTGYDVRVMDIQTGNVIFTRGDPFHQCPMSISPDNRWFVYASRVTRNDADLYLVELSTGERKLLAGTSPLPVVWSDDSSSFAFVTWYADAATLSIYHLESNMFETVGDYPFVTTYRWVDNELYYVVSDDGLTLYRWNETDNTEIAAISRPDGRILVSISPDGRFLQLISSEQNNIYTLNLVQLETGSTTLIEESSMFWDWSWLPDSTGFAFVDGTGDISLYNLDDNTYQQIAENNGNNYSSENPAPIWSSSGRYLAYRQYNAGGTYNENYYLKMIDIETGEINSIRTWVSTHAGVMQWISLTQLIYIYANSEEPSELNDLWLYDVETGENTQLTDTPELDEQSGCEWG